MRFAIIALTLLCAAAGTAAAADRGQFAALGKSRFVHCAFYKHYDKDPASGDPIMVEGRADALMHFQNVDAARSRASAIYTRMAGARDVLVVQTDKALHFIDSIAGMSILTTVHSCLEFDEKRGVCLMFSAANARVFDAEVRSDPDKVYEKIKDAAEPGFCDHSFIGTQEASNSTR